MQSVLADIMAHAQEMRILVVGDLMLDRFQTGKIVRESPESPGTPVWQYQSEILALGGAANVANNLRALGAQVWLAGTCGVDEEGQTLRMEAEALGINMKAVRKDPHRPTTTKTRIMEDGGRQLVRIDRESAAPLSPHIACDILCHIPSNVDGIILSDYQNGVLTKGLATAMIDMGNNLGVPVLVDPKGKDFTRYQGAIAITPNTEEAELATGIEIRTIWSALDAIDGIREQTQCRYVILKRGRDGMSFHDSIQPWTEHISANNLSPLDVTGAGDTVIAVLALGMALGCDPLATVRLANVAAGVVVGKVNTATVSTEEIRGALEIASFL